MKKDCVIVGAGTYGNVYAEYLDKAYNILGFIDDDEALIGKKIGRYNVLGNSIFLIERINKSTAVFVPIGDNHIRVKLLKKFVTEGFETPSFIHNKAIIHDTTKIGKAVYVLPTTCIMPFVYVGDFCMISIGVNIAHHAQIKKGCMISHGVNLGAFSTIDQKTTIGNGATILKNISIGKNVMVGAGTVVVKKISDEKIVVGNPGVVLKTKKS